MRTTKRISSRAALLGPAFVAAIAYVDPGNFSTNLSAGSMYGYLLVWVVVAANLMAGLVQYLSAKVGLVTGQSLPEVVRDRLPRWPRLAYWAQAEMVAIATDLAEVLGGAIALNLLFGLPLLVGGLITGLVSLVLLASQNRYGQRPFERIIAGLLLIIPVGFVAGLWLKPPDLAGTVGGLVPILQGPDSLLLAAGMLGATVMPHVIYLHSALARDRHGHVTDPARLRRLLGATRIDVAIAMLVAGGINLAMVLFAASTLHGVPGLETITDMHAATAAVLGGGVATLFAVGLLVSGLASTAVGCYAGAVIMDGLLKRRISLLVRRVVTLVPALILLGFNVEPTWLLVLSQVALSFGIPFAIVPLLLVTSRRSIMGEQVNSRLVTGLTGLIVALIVALNIALIGLTIM